MAEIHSQEEGQPEKRPQTERSDTETDVYLTDSDEYKLLRAMRSCMTSLVKISRTRLGTSHKLSVKVCKTSFDL